MVLDGVERLQVVGEAGDGDEAIDAVDTHHPHVVLMDIRMPRVNGIEATAALRRCADPPDVIVLTTFDADNHVLGALRAGASGFLLKDTPPPDLIAAIRRVAAGEPMLSPSVTRQLIALAVDQEPAPSHGDDRLDRLSGRERDVADAIGRGLTNAEIAREQYMSVATVKSYVTRLLTKLELDNRVQIALRIHGVAPTDPDA
jgi:DNA-binding NarL/FixJ family response regulator